MAEKAYTEGVDRSSGSDEQDEMRDRQPSYGAGGRRKSVAMNIVENPLKVSSSDLYPAPVLHDHS